MFTLSDWLTSQVIQSEASFLAGNSLTSYFHLKSKPTMPLVSTYLVTKYMHCDTMHFVQTILKLTLFYMHFLKLCIYNKGGRPGFNDDPLGSFHLYSILLVLKTMHSGQKILKFTLFKITGKIFLVTQSLLFRKIVDFLSVICQNNKQKIDYFRK